MCKKCYRKCRKCGKSRKEQGWPSELGPKYQLLLLLVTSILGWDWMPRKLLLLMLVTIIILG